MLIDHNFPSLFCRQQQPLRRKLFMTSTIPLTMSMNPTLWFRLRAPSIRRSPRQVIPTSSWSTLNAMPRPACWWRSSSKRCSRASSTRKATSRIPSAGKISRCLSIWGRMIVTLDAKLQRSIHLINIARSIAVAHLHCSGLKCIFQTQAFAQPTSKPNKLLRSSVLIS